MIQNCRYFIIDNKFYDKKGKFMNIGIVGAGKIVKEALPVMSEIPEIHIQSIVTTGRNPENVAQLQKQFDIKQVFEDFQAFIEDEKIDTVYLAVPNHLHFDYARKAIAKNKHVICEKPFTLTTEELIILKDLAEQQKVIIIEAITNLYLSNYDVLKQSIPEIEIAKLLSSTIHSIPQDLMILK